MPLSRRARKCLWVGLVAGSLTAISGSSTVFERGFNTYSNASKHELLGVPLEDITVFGAVSRQVASKMAEGILMNAPVDLTAAVTGVAGPDGGSLEKPVGTVHIASAFADTETLSQQFQFLGNRHQVRMNAVEAALNLLLSQVRD